MKWRNFLHFKETKMWIYDLTNCLFTACITLDMHSGHNGRYSQNVLSFLEPECKVLYMPFWNQKASWKYPSQTYSIPCTVCIACFCIRYCTWVSIASWCGPCASHQQGNFNRNVFSDTIPVYHVLEVCSHPNLTNHLVFLVCPVELLWPTLYPV